MPARLADELRTDIAEAIVAGNSRNRIAKHFDVSQGTVTNICREIGMSFDRTLTEAATKARLVDAERDRELAKRATKAFSMRDARKMLGYFDQVEQARFAEMEAAAREGRTPAF